MPRGRPRKTFNNVARKNDASHTVASQVIAGNDDDGEVTAYAKKVTDYPYSDTLISEVITDLDGKSIREFRFSELGVWYDTSLDLKIPMHMRAHTGNDVRAKLFGRNGIDYVRHIINHFLGIVNMQIAQPFSEDEALASVRATKQAEREKLVGAVETQVSVEQPVVAVESMGMPSATSTVEIVVPKPE